MILPKPGKYHFRAMRLRVAYPWGKGFLRPEVNTPKFDILNSFDSFTFHIILWKVNTTIRQSWIISCKSVTFFFQSRDEQYQERKIIQPLLRWVAHIFLNLWYEIKGSQRLLIFEFLSRRNVRAMVTAQFVRFWFGLRCCNPSVVAQFFLGFSRIATAPDFACFFSCGSDIRLNPQLATKLFQRGCRNPGFYLDCDAAIPKEMNEIKGPQSPPDLVVRTRNLPREWVVTMWRATAKPLRHRPPGLLDT